MAILIYTESEKGKLKKASLEVASYASAIAKKEDISVTAITINTDNPQELKKYGVSKVLNVNDNKLNDFNAKIYAGIINDAAHNENSNIIILSSTANSRYLAPILSVYLKAGYVSNVTDIPSTFIPYNVTRTAFTNKAYETKQVDTKKILLSLSKNAYGLVEENVSISIEDFKPDLINSKLSVKSIDKVNNKVTIADAEIVVSAGRGLKGPENWGMIEELADVLGAATACSKPVSDLGWRPHGEHVGQTGKPVASNLYIAIGISGAIQHLAGINSSKIKVVINSDSEAPFFKSADYGIVGDAFEVVPKLIEKLKSFKLQNV